MIWCSKLLIVVTCSLIAAASSTDVRTIDGTDQVIQQRKVVKMQNNCMANCPGRRYQEYCTIEVQAYSGYNSSCHGAKEGFVKLNGNTFWTAGWCSELGNSRGVTIINVDTYSCEASAIRQFDTHETDSNAVALSNYLKNLPIGTVVVGVTGDEPVAKLGPALETLDSLNVDVGDVQNSGNFAFVLQKGHSFDPVVAKGLDSDDEPAKIVVQLEDVCGILIQQHSGGTTFFNRNWTEYRNGFGAETGNYWIGNEMLHNLTVDGNYKLRVELLAKFDSKWYWAEYETFKVYEESIAYMLWVGEYSGTAGNSLASAHAVRFSTKERDNDLTCTYACAQHAAFGYNAGFWYSDCGHAYINAPDTAGNYGFTWYHLPTGTAGNWPDKKLVQSRMFLLMK